MTLKDRVCVVAGASGSIGREICNHLWAEGADVIALGRSKPRMIDAKLQGHAELFEADLTIASDLDRVVARLNRKPRLDALVLSSGIYERSTDPGTFRMQLEANLVGPYAAIQALLPMLTDSKGQIVFVNSSQALKATAGVGQFAATMHGFKALADSLRDEVNAAGIRVASLFLGRTAGARQEHIFGLEGHVYSGERLIQPDDIARTVAFLLNLPRTAEITDLTMRPMQK